MNQQELAAGLATVSAQVSKIGDESTTTLAKVTALEDALNNQTGDVSPEVQAAFDALKAQVQVVDDLITDTAVPDPNEGGEGPIEGEGNPA